MTAKAVRFAAWRGAIEWGASMDGVVGEQVGSGLTYCVVPQDLAAELGDLLGDHFADDPGVRVIVSRRKQDRRRRCRRQPAIAGQADDRRSSNPLGRRVADRRKPVARVHGLALPAAVWRYAQRLSIVRHRDPARQASEDAEAHRLIASFQAGDVSAMSELYTRYFDRVCSYARLLLHDAREAEDVAQQVFVEVYRRLPHFELRADQPFRAWVFWLTRNRVRDTVRRHRRLEVEPPAAIQVRSDSEVTSEAGFKLDWIEDAVLAQLLEALPVRQRQVLTLRYLADASTEEIGAVLGSSPMAVRILQHRALRTLERGMCPQGGRYQREPMISRIRPATVARGRRFALAGFGVRRAAQPALYRG